jgi:hypothetical protein
MSFGPCKLNAKVALGALHGRISTTASDEDADEAREAQPTRHQSAQPLRERLRQLRQADAVEF